ncbi:alpha/beta fold hydrolase [Saccharopolyspora hirsuta]|uniref:Alpha/beta hydrolase n=1 Tax=Saccharopolyspora hirsuta TaxID=1837 RepID=A0A5M7BQX9_SACHI|nr:alpha/beta fold hydrolase [Saccharopolyspora hirsuta]KAA5830548.1 alpha/beta hydrolase [Saccharopolyspora hirsuta]
MSPDRYLDRGGARIAYQLTGTGAPVGYAHGVLLSRDAVRRFELFDFDALGLGRQLLTYDQRGHGRSTGRPAADDYRFETAAGDLLALLDAAGIDQPADFAGSSWGCAAVLHAAVAAPRRFRRLALLIPPVSWESGPVQAKQWYFDTADDFDRLGAAGWRQQWARADPVPIFADHPKFDLAPDVADELIPAALRGVGSSELPAPEAISALEHPALILAWDTDPLHPVATAERLHELLPNSALHVSRTAEDVTSWTGRVADFFAR